MKKERKSIGSFGDDKLNTENVKGGFAHTKGSLDGLGQNGDVPPPTQDMSNEIAAGRTMQEGARK